MTDGFRVAVIGYGLAGSAFHAPFIEAVDGLEVSAVVTGNPERVSRVKERYPDATVFPDADALLTRAGDYDLVVVASPNRHHVPQAAAALESGVAVVVDKPVAATGDEIRSLVATAERVDRPFTVFQNRRWDGDFRTVRALLDAGDLGEVTRFESRFERVSSGHTSWKSSTDPADLADIVYDLGSHLVDQAIVLFGRPVTAWAETRAAREGGPGQDATVLLTHESGTRSMLRMSAMTTPVAPRFVLAGKEAGYRCWGLDPQEKRSVAGTSPLTPDFGDYPPDQWGTLVTPDGTTRRVQTHPGAYLDFYRQVAACLRGESGPPVPPQESVTLVDTLEAVLRSADSGETVTV